ncbi:MAG: ABC transporter permease, partial [Candidatus Cloacimonetes bacterium]|nr:ABC transporter permease [Candidatus Cloacimonadota bacterium]
YISRDTMRVSGVIENFNQMSLKTNIIPLAFPFIYASNDFFSMKVSPVDLQNTIKQIKNIWEKTLPGNPFEYFFLDDHFNNQYAKDIQFGRVFGIFSGLAIFIACLGLFALASFSAIQRTKEIGVRKVLGASVNSIVQLLAKDFLRLVVISIVVAIPATYFIMDSWLQNFAYRITIGWWIFLLSSLIVTFIAAITISYQTIKTAVSNPTKALKYE